MVRELDACHAEATSAFLRRDLCSYRELFSPGLEYTQLDGTTIGLDALMKNVAAQFERLHKAESTYSRESIEVIRPDLVTEVLTQTGSAEVKILGFFTKRWKLHRRGQYTWIRLDGRWVAHKVVVLEERLA